MVRTLTLDERRAEHILTEVARNVKLIKLGRDHGDLCTKYPDGPCTAIATRIVEGRERHSPDGWFEEMLQEWPSKYWNYPIIVARLQAGETSASIRKEIERCIAETPLGYLTTAYRRKANDAHVQAIVDGQICDFSIPKRHPRVDRLIISQGDPESRQAALASTQI